MWSRPSDLLCSPDIVRAEVKRVDAETESIRAAAVASSTKAAAETQAIRAAAVTSRMATVRAAAPMLTVAGLVVWLGFDYYIHENTAHLERRVAAALRGMQPPADPMAAGARLPVPGTPLVNSIGPDLPTMVLGPSGCGKSTALAALARDVASPGHNGVGAPTALIRIRLSRDPPASTDKSALGVDPARQALDETARAVFRQIGFPERRAILHSLFAGREFMFKEATFSLPTPSSSRLVDALRVLFRVSEDLFHERCRCGIIPSEAKPLLIFDEVQVRDWKLVNDPGPPY